MFQRILIATDGTALSKRAVETGVELAHVAGASVVGIHVRPPLAQMIYGDGSIMVPPEAESAHRERTTGLAKAYLREIEAATSRAGVHFEGVDVEDPSPADAILRIADAQGCDLIVMASHGRRGLSRVLLGSETSKVLTHASQAVQVTH